VTDETELRVDQRIWAVYHRLTPQERKAADALIAHQADLATYRAAELAVLADVSKATMSRLFRRLGFQDFDEMREHVRSLRSRGEPRQANPNTDTKAVIAADHEAIVAALRDNDLTSAISAISAAQRVLILGWRNSYPVALHARQQLSQARPEVRLAPTPGQTIGEDLVDLGPDDVVIIFGFRRRPDGFAAALAQAGATGATVILIADPTLRARGATILLQCPIQGPLAFDSYASAMTLISVLADGVLTLQGAAGQARVSRISDAYAAMGEVER
jgi:DNA-binding MurR/RpiR family transcriptional regulator